jgi:branched-chain amino acid aminotransferase
MSLPEPEGRVWMDGRWVPAPEAAVPLTDPSVQAGLGVFETVAVRLGRPLELPEHLTRLSRGAVALRVPLPEATALGEAAGTVASEVPGGYGWLKIVALRSGRCAVFGGTIDPAEEGRDTAAILLRWRRSPDDPLATLKTLNYAPFILGLEEARRRGAQEALWLNTRGHLAEGCSSSVFVVQGRKVFTAAPRDGILPGIVRGLVLRSARNLGLTVHEGKLRLRRLEMASEAFLSSSLRGIRPLVEFEGRPVGTARAGPITRAIAGEVARLRGWPPDPGPAPDLR